MGIVPKPLSADWVAGVIRILTGEDQGDKKWALDLFTNRVPPGVDEAAYVKASFLTAIVKGEKTCDLIDKKHAIYLLGGMQGGYNVATLVDALDIAEVAGDAAKYLSKTLLVYDAFHDVEE